MVAARLGHRKAGGVMEHDPWSAREPKHSAGAKAKKAAARKATEPEPEASTDEAMFSEEETGEACVNTVAAGQLRAFVERVERLEEDKKSVGDDIKLVYAEMKANGFDTKAVRAIIRLRKKDQAERQEEEAMIDLYKAALGMA
ncbi:DUF2312 domain-containing protein [Tritonibacter mobilis]|uniref:DUF2312 domain-containing protein n=2 Tax=Alphaproteobacteria TaxID=28211 RepID=UPI002E2CCDC1|nr:DUF2312 domain-containing protein [Tritonibacter mobilis]